jgi:hypothetical protein
LVQGAVRAMVVEVRHVLQFAEQVVASKTKSGGDAVMIASRGRRMSRRLVPE